MSLLRSSFVVSILSLLGSAISFINQLMLAHLFGASSHMDAYLIAVSLPLMVSGTITAVLSYTMVPAIINYRSDGCNDGKFAGLIFFCLLTVSFFMLIVGYFVSPTLIGLFANSLTTSIQIEAVLIARISWVSAASGILVGYFGAIHNTSKRFYGPVLAGILPYLGMMLWGFAFGKALGPVAIAWGLLFGTCLSGAVLLKGAFQAFELKHSCFGNWPLVVRYFAMTPLVFVAMGCFTVYQSIDAFWATRIGPGNMAYLGYCQRLLTALGSLVIAGPSVVLVPRLTEAYIEGRHQDFLDDLGRALRMVFIFAFPLAVMISILSVPIIELLFQRGAFDTVATNGVASILPFMMFGMVAMLGVVVVFRALYARKQVVTAALLGTIAALSYFILSGVLSSILQVQGIALSYMISWWLVFAIAVILLWRNEICKLRLDWQKTFLFQLASTLAFTGVAVYIGEILLIIPLRQTEYWGLALRTISVVAIGTGVFYFSTIKLFKMSDVIQIIQIVNRV